MHNTIHYQFGPGMKEENNILKSAWFYVTETLVVDKKVKQKTLSIINN